jgi:hypothetical protein
MAQDPELLAIIESERTTSIERMTIIIIMFFGVVFLNLIKGGGRSMKSPVGIECGSFSYWGITGLVFVWLIGISIYIRGLLIEKWKLKRRLNYIYAEGDIEWNERNVIFFKYFYIIIFL